jgi:hypothetical protein
VSKGDKKAFSVREIEAAFIDGHWQYGARIHEEAATALHEAFGRTEDTTARHGLFSRLFGEYAATLETFAAWAIALRSRGEPGSFLAEYMGYENFEIGRFYEELQQHKGDLSDLLRLPSAETLIAIAIAREGEDLAKNLDGYSDSLKAMYQRLKMAADQYFENDRVVVDAYNKTKHGAPMIRLHAPANDDTFEILLRNPQRKEPGEPPYRFARFTATPDSAQRMLDNVTYMTGSIQELAVLTKLLSDSDLLFVEG